MATKISQLVVRERDARTMWARTVAELQQLTKHPDLWVGQRRTWTSKSDEISDRPAEYQKVQVMATDQLRGLAEVVTGLINVTAARDLGNRDAVADLIVDGKTLATGLPVPFLLWFEGELDVLEGLLRQMPTNPSQFDWKPDQGGSGLYVTDPSTTGSTQKVMKSLELVGPTKEHAGQYHVYEADEAIGTWTTIRQSGAMREDQKQELLRRLRKLSVAVKLTREAANSQAAPDDVTIGKNVVDHLFDGIL